jgi:putative FmdB family regulatory protein
MPIYEYRCDNGHTLEVMHRMSDDPLASCTACDAPVQRVFHPVAVHFKGSGFYTTDYKNKGNAGEEKKQKADSDSSSKSSTDSSTGAAKSDGSDPKAKAASSETKSAS